MKSQNKTNKKFKETVHKETSTCFLELVHQTDSCEDTTETDDSTWTEHYLTLSNKKKYKNKKKW